MSDFGHEDMKTLERYALAAKEVLPLFRELAGALETKKIDVYGDRIEAQVKGLREAHGLLEEMNKLAAQLERKVEPRDKVKFTQLARDVDKRLEKLDDLDIEWDLDTFLDHTVPVVRLLREKRPTDSLELGLEESAQDFLEELEASDD